MRPAAAVQAPSHAPHHLLRDLREEGAAGAISQLAPEHRRADSESHALFLGRLSALGGCAALVPVEALHSTKKVVGAGDQCAQKQGQRRLRQTDILPEGKHLRAQRV